MNAPKPKKQKIDHMKTPTTKNTIVDKAHDLTYVVMAYRTLTDGELYSAIRVELLNRRGKRPVKGETVIINTAIGA